MLRYGSHPISQWTYHDAHLLGIEVDGDRAEFKLRSEAGALRRVVLEGVEFLIAKDVLKGNVVLHLDAFAIGPENEADVAEVIAELGSEYAPTSLAAGLVAKSRRERLWLVLLVPTYGAYACAVCRRIRDDEEAGDA